MPSLVAGLAAWLAGWIVDALVEPYLGLGPALILSLPCSILAFYFVRNWLTELRGG